MTAADRPRCPIHHAAQGGDGDAHCLLCIADAVFSDVRDEFLCCMWTGDPAKRDEQIRELLTDPDGVVRQWHLDTIADWLAAEAKRRPAA